MAMHRMTLLTVIALLSQSLSWGDNIDTPALPDLVWRIIQAPDHAAYASQLSALEARSKEWTWPQLETWIRQGPAFPANAPNGHQDNAHKTEYHSWASSYFLYVPKSYSPDKPAPLLVIMNGGNSNMTDQKARFIAKHYLDPWVDLAEERGWILMSPAAAKGWGVTGYALAFSAINEIKKTYNINPDMICGWGQSMGGHAAWRMSWYAPDRWAGLSPVCGGHATWADSLTLTKNLALYQVWGEQDPHPAKLNEANRVLAKKLKELGYDHRMIAKQGGHELFEDTFTDILEYFERHPRNLYPASVPGYTSAPDITAPDGGPGQEAITWTKPLPWTKRWYWYETLEKTDPAAGSPLTAERTGPNAFTVTTKNVKRFAIYLHDKLVDFSKPVTVIVNDGKPQSFTPKRSLRTLFDNIRAYGNDRGRIFFGQLDIDVPVAGAIQPPPVPPTPAETVSHEWPRPAQETIEPVVQIDKRKGLVYLNGNLYTGPGVVKHQNGGVMAEFDADNGIMVRTTKFYANGKKQSETLIKTGVTEKRRWTPAGEELPLESRPTSEPSNHP